jgi:hypothetical protein
MAGRDGSAIAGRGTLRTAEVHDRYGAAGTESSTGFERGSLSPMYLGRPEGLQLGERM